MLDLYLYFKNKFLCSFQFEESEKKRLKSEQLRQEEKHKKQYKALVDKNEAAVHELEQLQVCH